MQRVSIIVGYSGFGKFRLLTDGMQSRVLVLVPGPPQSSPEHTLQSPHSVNWHSGISQVPCSSSFATGHPKLPSSCHARSLINFSLLRIIHVQLLTAGIQSRVLVLVPGPPQSSPEHTPQSPQLVNGHSGMSQEPCSSSVASWQANWPSSCLENNTWSKIGICMD